MVGDSAWILWHSTVLGRDKQINVLLRRYNMRPCKYWFSNFDKLILPVAVLAPPLYQSSGL